MSADAAAIPEKPNTPEISEMTTKINTQRSKPAFVVRFYEAASLIFQLPGLKQKTTGQ